MFYEFIQGSPGARFLKQSPYVLVVEADNEDQAKAAALTEPYVYFNGIEQGYDCPGCEDRWEDCPVEYDEFDIKLYEKETFKKQAIDEFVGYFCENQLKVPPIIRVIHMDGTRHDYHCQEYEKPYLLIISGS